MPITVDKKPSAAQVLEEKLVAIYEAATVTDKTKVAELVARARDSKPDSAVMPISPGMAALLFFDHNKQNREWSYASTLHYLQQIEQQEWEFTNQGIGFLVSSNVGDGQHRLAAIALSTAPVLTLVAFGMSERSIVTLDTGRRRQAADYLHIIHPDDDVKEIRSMQQTLVRAFGYLAKNPNEDERRRYILKTNRDRAKAVEANKALLRQAMSLGKESVRGRAKPPFTESEANTTAFLLLVAGFPAERIAADLDQFQSGEDRTGSDSPIFQAAQIVAKDAAKRERSSITARLGAVVKAFLLHEQGITAVRSVQIREAMKPKQWVNPTYPDKPASTIHAAE